jgi:hypothetical protein
LVELKKQELEILKERVEGKTSYKE